MLQDRGNCGCVPGGEGTPHPETRHCAHCGRLVCISNLRIAFIFFVTMQYAYRSPQGSTTSMFMLFYLGLHLVLFHCTRPLLLSAQNFTFQVACHILQDEYLPCLCQPAHISRLICSPTQAEDTAYHNCMATISNICMLIIFCNGRV